MRIHQQSSKEMPRCKLVATKSLICLRDISKARRQFTTGKAPKAHTRKGPRTHLMFRTYLFVGGPCANTPAAQQKDVKMQADGDEVVDFPYDLCAFRNQASIYNLSNTESANVQRTDNAPYVSNINVRWRPLCKYTSDQTIAKMQAGRDEIVDFP